MYMVVDVNNLNNESGYLTYVSVVDWESISNTPNGLVQAVDAGDVLDDVTVEYATKTYVDELVGDINSVLESIIND